MKIGIIGVGIVGTATMKLMQYFDHDVVVYDKYKDSIKGAMTMPIKQMTDYCEVIFLCLPTPSNKNGTVDMTAFTEVMPQLIGYQGLVVIKSTVLPGTNERYYKQTGLNMASNPEFLTEKNAVMDAAQPDRLVFGTRFPDDLKKLRKVYAPLIRKMPAGFVKQMNPTEAELSKYMCNCLLAMKVIFANEMYDLCENLDISYEQVKKVVTSDHRIGETHLDVDSNRGYGGMCFPKDTKGLLAYSQEQGVDLMLLKSTVIKNEIYRMERGPIIKPKVK